MNGPAAYNRDQAESIMPATLDWIVVGGESGPRARHFDLQWARDTIRQCREAGVPVFVKQLGADPRGGIHDFARREWQEGYARPLKDRKGGTMEEWPEDLRVREYPNAL
jgi:hypothetical protein